METPGFARTLTSVRHLRDHGTFNPQTHNRGCDRTGKNTHTYRPTIFAHFKKELLANFSGDVIKTLMGTDRQILASDLLD